jgi:hypothetical protein
MPVDVGNHHRRNVCYNCSMASTPPRTPITLPQLLELVERACRGDKILSQQLFGVFMQMRLRPNTPPNEAALANLLIRVLIGERQPGLDGLDEEDIQPVKDLLDRLTQP